MWIAPPSIRSAYAAALACSTKALPLDFDTWASEAAACSTLSGKLTQSASWKRAWKKEAWMRRLFGSAISPNCPPGDFAEWWTSSLLGSRVKTCPSPAAALASTESDPGCSSTSSMSQTIAVRGGSFWRTSQASLLPPPPLWTRPKGLSTSARPPASWENWPTAAGMRSGSLFLRPTWAPRTAALDGSVSPGAWLTPHGMSGQETATGKAGAGGEFAKQATQWMTPNVPNGGRHVPESLVLSKGMTPEGEKRTVGLESQTKYWSSPRATDGAKGGPNQRGSMGDMMLPSMAAQWPTPMAADQRGSAGAGKAELPNIVQSWPTPAARDFKGHGAQGGASTDGREITHGPISERCGLFAPSPSDTRWPGLIAAFPWLAPALESTFRGVVNGLAFNMDDCRAARLKCVGNGVVAAQAGCAVAILFGRSGLNMDIYK